MYWFYVPAILTIVLAFWMASWDKKYSKKPNPVELFFGIFIIGLLGSVLIGLIGVTIGSGLMPEYSVGERVGYVTKFSKKGIFWKTWEGEIQVGTGNMAALQKPHPFSVRDKKIIQQIKNNMGRKVHMKYHEWLIVPVHVGRSSYEIVDIKWLDVKKDAETATPQ